MPDIPNRLAEALADRYRLERELGQGGMATVYLAEDLKHRRKVALKVLRPELAATLGPARFLREIELAAKLQHPHILPLHDSGEAQGFLYYVMPFVDGENLRGRLTRRGELPIQEAVRLLAEVADALSYAHSQGVVHRDIKPDNVLLSGRHALVTDFGVAKAVSEATGRQDLTTAGIALGTPAYMAPEQAAGDPHIDHRVDIYALGAMGYELLTGTPPFTGQWPQEVLAAHVTQAPEPITSRRPQISAALGAIVMKCLAKRAADRWQSAEELVSQLEQQLTPSGGTTPPQTQAVGAARQPSMLRWVLPAALALMLVAVALLLSKSGAPQIPVVGKRSAVTFEPGLETNAAISPDGKLVAYSRITPAESRLVVQQLAGGEPVTVGSWPGVVTSMPAWSPDGARLMLRSPRGIEIVPALGGVPRLLVASSAEFRPAWGAWAPEGNAVAYTSADTVYIRDLDADSTRVLAISSQAHSPAWSPDGKWIAFVSGNIQYATIGNLAPSSIWVAPAAGGTPTRVTEDRPLHTSPVWLPDSRGLLYVSDRDGGRDVYNIRLTRSGAPDGEAKRLTTGLHPHTISLSADGRRLVYGLDEETANVSAVQLRPDRSVSLREARAVTSGSQVIESFAVSPDRRWLVFDSNRNGNQDIWRMPLDGSAPPEALSTGPEDEFQASFSPDGKHIVFHAVVSGSQRDMYQVPFAGGKRTRITVPTQNNLAPRISPDGRSLLYTVWGDQGDNTVRAMRRPPGDTGWDSLTAVFSVPSITPGGGDWSPDGRWVSWAEGRRILRANADGSSQRVLAEFGPNLAPFYTRWKGDSRTVYYSGVRNDGTYVIDAVPAEGGVVREAAHSEGPTYQTFRFPFSVVGNELYVVLADRQSDIWTAELLRK
jgi:eukaryotic-like serine/threonine-protein kinase